MAVTIDDFAKIWASTSPLTPYEFSESNYKNGWNFIGGTPPSRQMWDFLQKNNDEKMQYLANNYLPLSGGTMTGDITFDKQTPTIAGNERTMLTGGTNNIDGSSVQFYPYNYSDSNVAGTFVIRASNRSSFEDTDPTHKNIDLVGKPDGTLTWGGVSLTDGNLLTVRHVTIYPSQSGVAVNIGNVTAPAVSGYQFVCWFFCVSDGGVYPCYASSPDSSTTAVWGNNVATGTSVWCYALYVRKW